MLKKYFDFGVSVHHFLDQIRKNTVKLSNRFLKIDFEWRGNLVIFFYF